MILHLLHFVKTSLGGSLYFFLKSCISYTSGAMINSMTKENLRNKRAVFTEGQIPQ